MSRYFTPLSPSVLAIVLMLGAVTLFSAGHGLVRFASTELHPFQTSFLRSFFGLVFVLPLIMKGPDYSDLRIKLPKMHLIRGISSSVATLAWFTAVATMPLGEAVALNFTAPLFATILAAIFLHEVVRAKRWAATLVGFMGVLIVIRPGVETIQLGALLSLGSAMMISVNVLMIRVMAQVDSARAIVTSFNLFLTIFTLIPALFVWQSPSLIMIGVTFAIGALTTLAHLMLTSSMRIAEASAVIPLDFVRLPLSALIGFIWFMETPDLWTIVGALIIGVSAIYIARDQAMVGKVRKKP
jgi:drug/metabolite transporter (DMT)-like permease